MTERKTYEQKRASGDSVVRCLPNTCESDGQRHFDGESYASRCLYCGRFINEDD